MKGLESRKSAGGRLKGRVAIVTGAGSKSSDSDSLVGTGKAIAVQMAREGCAILLVDRHEDRAIETRRMIEEEGGEAAVLALELTDPSSSQRIASEALNRFGRIDILVNNAAAYAQSKFLETTQEDVQAVVAVNLIVPLMLSQAVIPAMIKAGGGSVVYISSILAMRGPGPVAYAASKAGLMGLATSLANSFGEKGIRFNCVAPGMVDTPVRRALIARSGIDLSANPRFSGTPLNVQGDAWDVAHTVAFLSSDEGRYLTGLMIPVDGGSTTRL
ncbi:NAD(P)-dependent dehydrogenase, short-chain alcohol dehydrogenase family [Sphingomonas sp. YR710]|jgi:NAD(P)-dependent dehydrogenase (short-subunit alcohol dehydrogenase family)|uniref:SDR family NAD(P)-dependent oxidoreductase n=1 Tax=Sphingomonas sp. YR710 TaxID=1882773 RepID=UPI000887D23E|nr:SDR family oxidoreductase [Sphingomonas sp. YR710]SDD10367.1 NAD(P)-dependent dehydrogenase, short-chain alcohol dehydrogenase family [Sphingomonas sp. YR710]